MHFVRIFSIKRAFSIRLIAVEEVQNHRKIVGYTSKTFLKMAGRRMHTPHFTSLDPLLAISYKNYQKSLAHFSHLAPSASFFLTKRRNPN